MLSGGEVRAAGISAIFPLGLKKGGGAEKREDGISSFDRYGSGFSFARSHVLLAMYVHVGPLYYLFG